MKNTIGKVFGIEMRDADCETCGFTGYCENCEEVGYNACLDKEATVDVGEIVNLITRSELYARADADYYEERILAQAIAKSILEGKILGVEDE